MTYICNCSDINLNQWNQMMKGAKPINYNWLVNKIKRELPSLYEELSLNLYNPYAEYCKVNKKYYILVSSATEYFIEKN